MGCRQEGMFSAPGTSWEGIGLGLSLWLEEVSRPARRFKRRLRFLPWRFGRLVHTLTGQQVFHVRVDYTQFMQGLSEMGIEVDANVTQQRFGHVPEAIDRIWNTRMCLWEPGVNHDWATVLSDLRDVGHKLTYPIQLDDLIRLYPWLARDGRVVLLGVIDGPDADGWEQAVVYERRDGRYIVTTTEVGQDHYPKAGDRVLIYARTEGGLHLS